MEEFSSEVNRLIQQSQALGWEKGLPEVLPDEEEASRASKLSLVGKILSQGPWNLKGKIFIWKPWTPFGGD
jgi:hypothetical protein